MGGIVEELIHDAFGKNEGFLVAGKYPGAVPFAFVHEMKVVVDEDMISPCQRFDFSIQVCFLVHVTRMPRVDAVGFVAFFSYDGLEVMYRALLSQSGFSMERLATICETADVGSFSKKSGDMPRDVPVIPEE